MKSRRKPPKKRIYVPHTISIHSSLTITDAIITGRHRSRIKQMWTWLLVRLHVVKEVHTEYELREALGGR